MEFVRKGFENRWTCLPREVVLGVVVPEVNGAVHHVGRDPINSMMSISRMPANPQSGSWHQASKWRAKSLALGEHRPDVNPTVLELCNPMDFMRAEV